MPPIILDSVVERVAQKVNHNKEERVISPATVQAAAEKYRLLETRVPVGRLPSSKKLCDSAERRAAVLLECTARERQNNTNDGRQQQQSVVVSWSDLAAAIHVQAAPLEPLQHVLLHYLHQPQPPPAQRRNAPQPQQRNLRNRFHTVNYKDPPVSATTSNVIASSKAVPPTTTAHCYTPRVLPALVIRLAGHLPVGVQSRTQKLLEAIYGYYERPSTSKAMMEATERRGHLYDLQRYAGAYEAAALYHVATTATDKSNSHDGLDPEDNRHYKKKTKKTWSTAHDQALENDDDEPAASSSVQLPPPTHAAATLQVSDLVDAGSGAFTYLQVQQVLPRVQELARRIAAEPQQRVATASATALHHQRRRQRPKRPWHDHGKDLEESSLLLLENPLAAAAASQADEDAMHAARTTTNTTTTKRTKRLPVDDDAVPSFAEWKAHVLTQACQQARQQQSVILSDREATAWAANDILRRHGLLPTTVPTTGTTETRASSTLQ